MDPYQPPSKVASVGPPLDQIQLAIDHKLNPWAIASQIYTSRLILLLSVFLVIWLPINLIEAYLEQYVIDPDDFMTSWRVDRQADFWFGIICTGAAVAVTAATYAGKQIGFGEAMIEGLRRWPKLWTASFVYSICVGLGLLVLIVPGIYVAIRGFYTLTIAAAEEVHGPTAIRRSFELTEDRWLETFVRAIIVGGVYVLAMVVLMAAITGLLFCFEFDDWTQIGDDFYLYPAWIWIPEGIVACLILFAQAFSAVYVYCWYRHLDRLQGGLTDALSDRLDTGLIEQMGRQSPQNDVRW